MSSASSKKSTPRNTYVRPSEARIAEKKLAQMEKQSKILNDVETQGLKVRTKKDLGEGAMVLLLGQEGNNPHQLVLHRKIGDGPEQTNADWVLSKMGQVEAFLRTKNNPYREKTQQKVTEIKMNFAVANKLLMKDANGTVKYPDGTVRDEELGVARALFETHKKVEGAKTFTPSWAYAPVAVQQQEIALLNALHGSAEVEKSIVEAAKLYRAYQVKDAATGAVQTEIAYLKGIPEADVVEVVLDTMRRGGYDKSRWDALKVVPPRKADPFEMWAYSKGNMDPAKLKDLTDAIKVFGEAKKAYNKSVPVGKDAVANETEMQKSTRASLHEAMQKAAHLVNEKEKFAFELPKQNGESRGRAALAPSK